MSFQDLQLSNPRPSSIENVELPRREAYYPSPVDWRNEVLYFLLPDRFSDGQETSKPLLDRSDFPAARPVGFDWGAWAESGSNRFQGGTIAGITSKLAYLQDLGVTTLWIGPVFKQRRHLNTYHGYGVQDFLEIDPHFGDRKALVDLVAAAHHRGMRIILDIIFNHSGHNWDYENDLEHPGYKPWPEHYQIGRWLGGDGGHISVIARGDDGVWPLELQRDDCYTRAGTGSLGGEDVDNDHAEIKRTDFDGQFRDFNLDDDATLNFIGRCYKYWIALTDCDGFRLDTLKHVPKEKARDFCGSVKEFAANLGKANFFLVGEVGGPDDNAGRYLDALGLNLNAALDIGELRLALRSVAKGFARPRDYFDIIKHWDPALGSHRNSGPRHVTILDDHDHVFGDKIRFSSDASPSHQVAAGVAIQLFSLGVPCIYYGTEQAFSGPQIRDRDTLLPDYRQRQDKYLREIMFGADHPRREGAAGITPGAAGLDLAKPAFGAFGTVGRHCFDADFHVFRRIKGLIALRQKRPVMRYGRLYLREISNFNQPFKDAEAGELIAWSRILDDEEALCVINGNGESPRGGDVVVAVQLNGGAGAFMEVIHNTAQTIAGAAYAGSHPQGEKLPVKTRNGWTYVEIRGLAPAETLVLTNRP